MPVTADELHYLEEQKAARRRLRIVGAIVVVLVALVAVRWFSPVPSPVFHSAVSTSVDLPGALPGLPWPITGAAALSVEGAGSLGGSENVRPVPVAGLSSVMTTYVILKDHPLSVGASGPVISVTAPTIAAAQSEAAL
jgi:hypothetical protein